MVDAWWRRSHESVCSYYAQLAMAGNGRKWEKERGEEWKWASLKEELKKKERKKETENWKESERGEKGSEEKEILGLRKQGRESR